MCIIAFEINIQNALFTILQYYFEKRWMVTFNMGVLIWEMNNALSRESKFGSMGINAWYIISQFSGIRH